jgi:hypothetical protein
MGRIVTIFGPSSGSGATEGTESYAEALRLGHLLGEAGFAICNGGYGGTMEAAARGAREAGAEAIGITVEQFDPSSANLYISDERKAPNLFERLRRLTALGDALVCLRGGVGTLTEFNLTWTLLQTRAVPRKPFLCVGPAWRAILDTYRQHTLARPKDYQLITLVDGVDEAVTELVARIG